MWKQKNQTKVYAVVSYPNEVEFKLKEHEVKSKFYSNSISKHCREESCS